MELSRKDIVSVLQSALLFQGLPKDILDSIAALVEPVAVAAGQTIGDTGESLYIIVGGNLRLEKGERTLQELSRGEILGETALIQSAGSTGTVRAVKDSLLLQLDKQAFLDLLRKRSEAIFAIVGEYANRLRTYTYDLSTFRDQLENVILPLGIELAAEHDRDRLVERILVEAMLICNADSGLIFMRSENNTLEHAALRIESKKIFLGGTSGKPVPYSSLSLEANGDGIASVHDVAVRVARNGMTVNVPDIYLDTTLDFVSIKERDTELGYRSESCLVVPLKNQDGAVIGVMQLVNAQDPQTGKLIPFNTFQQLVVESLTSQAAVALNAQILLRSQEQLAKLEQDLNVARRIQAGFLPRSLPQPQGWEIAASFEPARDVAGDFYDAFMMTQGRRVGFVIADVVDKGVPAALFMALVRSLTRAFAQQNYSVDWSTMLGDESTAGSGEFPAPRRRRALPSAGTMSLYNAVLLTNNYIVENHIDDNMFATLFFGMLDPLSGRLSYVNAGHNPPLLLSGSGELKAQLTNTGTAVGMLPNVDYKIETVEMEPGDMLFTYTDGVTEARNVEGTFLTEPGLLQLLSGPVTSAETILAHIQAELHRFMEGAVQADDITMLAVRRLPDHAA